MKFLSICIFAIALLPLWSLGRETRAIVDDVVKYSSSDARSISEYISDIGDTRKLEAIEMLKSHPARRDSAVAQRLDVLLMGLGDDETTTKILSLWWTAENGFIWKRQLKMITDTQQPHLIPWLIYDLNRDELATNGMRGDEFAGPPRSVFAAIAILKLCDSPPFSADVREWAQNLSKTLDNGKYEAKRAVVRKWWEENKQLFKEGQYREVRPPRP